MRLAGAAATPDGGAVVLGVGHGIVDFGDGTLTVGGQTGFVAGFDATGATRWAFVPPFEVGHFAVSGNDQISRSPSRASTCSSSCPRSNAAHLARFLDDELEGTLRS
jgi:hypothetical protein